ncbi:MAG TPA: isoprenylcysteine carboxylmethyltransferase family protein [Tepidisphaeraceae bacterium]|nr:isoprenylcysteine carboxylmethyltransferase family protein [Tepidisphaeraceae bacterium]
MRLDRSMVVDSIQALWIIWAAYWLVNAFGNKRSVYRQSVLRGFFYRVIVVGAIVVLFSVGSHKNPIFSETVWTQIGGVVLCAAGIGLAIWARRILGTNWSGLITLKENHELIRHGPYRFVRHPIYSGVILAMIGTVLAIQPFLQGLAVLAILAIALKLKSLGEEKLMMSQFPDSYPRYKNEVKSLIPFVL